MKVYSDLVQQMINASDDVNHRVRLFPIMSDTQAVLHQTEQVRARLREIESLLNVIHAWTMNALREGK